MTTASEAYAQRATTVNQQLDELRQCLTAHAARQAGQPLNYGFAGDLGHVEQELRGLLEFFGGSAVER